MSIPFVAKSHSFWPTAILQTSVPKGLGQAPFAICQRSDVFRRLPLAEGCNRLLGPSHGYSGRQKTKTVLVCRQARRSFTVGVVIDTSVIPGKPR
ncbi:unnamed protein product [Macrosiphum euphorbiae]|uniref:Uncharacterized protein n=1 Tax=Macrosiphum euphorbiae TaxID=13131 RepID=A0AAV0WNA9_9HEMI|nr:unnamed protein product [Macrosiphum euphorbiae]